VRFPETWRGELTNYEIRNIVLALLVLLSWLLFLWFNGSRDTNILGFGADEYKKLINATLLSFTSVAFVSYIFKLEISRLFVLSVFPFGLLVLFIVRRILRRRLLRARNQGRYLSRVLLLHSGISDPVERRLALAQHAGFSVVHKIVTAENFKLDVKEIVSNALNNNCDQIMVGQSAVISAAELRNLGWALEQTTIDLIVAPAVTEIAGPRLKVSNVEGLPLLHLEQPTFSGASRVTKRVLDLTISIVGLIVVSPVLLIDELDRSDEEFEAFLLELLSAFQITIPELGTIKAKNKPYVILTSNRTRELSDALKRRCLYHWIDYPGLEKEMRIVGKRLPNIEHSLLEEVVKHVQLFRQQKLNKIPGISETIDWAESLMALGHRKLNQQALDQTLGVILKSSEDIELIRHTVTETI
jgi:hypothetical protein